MKKFYLLFLLMLLPLVASADRVEINGIYYELNSTTKQAQVTGNPNHYTGKIVIPKTVTYQSVKYSVTSIGCYAFSGCSGLTSVSIPNSVSFILESAFQDCKNLASLTLGNGLKEIDRYAFEDCNIGEVHISDLKAWCEIYFWHDSRFNCNPLSYASHLYVNGEEITDLVIPDGVTVINELAFFCCNFLTSVTIPKSVTSIGDVAFYNCNSLKTVNINGATTIAPGAFSGTPWYNNQPDGVVYAGKVLYKYKGIMSNGTKINIKEGTLGITDGAFSNCSGLTSVTIPNSVTTIGGNAFYNCSGLTSVTIPNSVTSIGSSAFSNCSGLTSVTIPNSVTCIGDYAFYNCSSLTSATIPTNVTSIGKSAFSKCSGLTTIKVKSGNTIYDSRENCNAIIETASNSLLFGCKNTIIPNSVTSIGNSAFSNCNDLTSITIPNSVTSIESGAFYGCSGLATIKVKSGNTIYDSRENCNAIIEKASNSLLFGCKNTIIPNSVTSIGNSAFSNCSGLTSITIPNSVTSIGYHAFWGCSSLKSVTIPNSVTSIGFDAFYNCSGLKSATIGNNVTRIEDDTFYGCNSLATVMLGNGINYIGSHSFEKCGQLIDFYCFAEDMPSIGYYGAFSNSYINNVTLHVPAASVDAYKAKSPWSGFKDIVAIETVKVKLSKSKATIEKGKTVTLKATVSPSTFPDKSVTWKSSNTKVATVTSSGKVKGVKAGTATITCTSNLTGAKATCKVTVGYVSLDKTEAVVKKGKTLTLTPTVYPSSLTDKSVTWESSDTKIATVTEEGKVKGVKYGTATITCTSNATGLSTTCAVLVGNVVLNESKVSIQKGKTTTLKATVYPSSLEDKSVTWKSSDESVATVSSTGKVKGVKYGTATITCTSNATGLSSTCKVTVGKVIISMSEFTLKKTRTTVLTATVYPSSLTDKSVTWESSDKSVATVTAEGKVKGIKAGTATITCTSVATGLKGTCTVTVLSTSGTRSVEEDDDDTTGIEMMEDKSAVAEPYDVYDLSGRKVRNQVTSLEGLANGVYIVNGKKVLKK
jgi:uncharacterized protein YjdB